jgi:hypothetical protein
VPERPVRSDPRPARIEEDLTEQEGVMLRGLVFSRLLGVAAIAVAGLAAAVVPASASVVHHVYRTCSTPGGCGLWLRSAPAPGASHLGLMNDGDAFAASCWVTGPTVINDPVWLQGTWNGRPGWAEDYYIDTHWSTTADLTRQGIPHCGTTAPPGGSTAAETAAVNWARPYVTASSTSYSGLCLTFVFKAYAAAGLSLRNWVNVGISATTYPQNIWGHFTHGHTGTGTPPFGALVFFNATARHSITYSHVPLSTGGGNLISTSDAANESYTHDETLAQHAAAHPWMVWFV